MREAIALNNRNSARDLLLFTIGLNTGLRISDIVKLQVKDVYGKKEILLRETKTNKKQMMPLSESLQREITNYVDTMKMEPEHYLFYASRGKGGINFNKHITPMGYYMRLQAAADLLGYDYIGTHTMRKTFGYHHYQRNKDVALLQYIFNHSSPSITLGYIGITDEQVEKSVEGFYI